MALLTAARRPLALLLLAALLTPALVMPFRPIKEMSEVENRLLARAPEPPESAAGWLGLPRRLDAFLADHFAFRDEMIRANNRLFGRAPRRAASGPADLAAAVDNHAEDLESGGSGELALAVDGKAGHMFLTQGLLESTGHDLDPRRAADYARFVCAMGRRLQARGVRLIFAIAPSPATIYPEFAPDWALPPRSPTDYDLILKDAAACGAPGVDLRPALRAAKAQTPLYRLTDSHWRQTGGLIAYNKLVAAIGRSEWALDPTRADWKPVTLTDGDLPRLAGLPARAEADLATHYIEPPPGSVRRPIPGRSSPEGPPFEVDSGRAGRSLLIIGDSYTEYFFPGFFLNSGLARVGWLFEDRCRFDWRAVEAFRPNDVLIMPVERFARCEPRGARPHGFPP